MASPNHLKLFLPVLCIAVIAATSASVLPSPFPASPPSPSGWDDDTDYPTTPPPPPAPCNPDDRAILLQIKQAFNNSDIFNTWIPDTDCCTGWDFVGCDSVTGRVNVFQFFGYLPPIFPPVIGNLSYLNSLVFRNSATGPITASLANLKYLSYLDLSNNRLSGPIPGFFANFRNLAILVLDNNRLTGRIPNQLSLLPKLYFISMGNNQLTGHIPEGLFNLFRYGGYLMLKSNKLKGSIPRSFAGIKFQRLDLSNNDLRGDASFLFGKDKWLWYLDLSGNKLSFNMTALEVNSDVMTLLLNNNKIYGSLPSSLVDARLFFFTVSRNRLCGRIPVGGSLQGFGASAYSGNKCLCGTPLPPCK